ncbi:MAG: DUF4339 domain-containing protein [Pigmentiphaga sp.]
MYEIHIGREGKQFGPFSEEQVHQMALDGSLLGTDLFWCAGMDHWEPATAIIAAVKSETATSPPPMPTPALVKAARFPSSQADGMGAGREARQIGSKLPTSVPSTKHAVGRVEAPSTAVKVNAEEGSDQPLSQTWLRRFQRIEQVVGPNMSRYSSLSLWEKLGLYLGFRGAGINILAGLFGALYYLAKGMWRPAISRLLLLIVVNQLLLMLLGLDALRSPWLTYGLGLILSFLLVGGPANMHYYRKVKLGDKSWW